MVIAKQGADLHTSNLTQMMAYELLKDGFLAAQAPRLCAVYRERSQALLAAMDKHLPNGVEWTVPQGGFFVWVKLPEPLQAAELLPEVVNEGVAYVPGLAFFADDGFPAEPNTLRLSFSYAEPEVLEEGIRRLARVLARHIRV
jgi:2-aminoadipate transaminase